MIEPFTGDDLTNLEPVHELDGEPSTGIWTRRLVLFLRVMAGVSMLKGLYHWSRVCGIGATAGADTTISSSFAAPFSLLAAV